MRIEVFGAFGWAMRLGLPAILAVPPAKLQGWRAYSYTNGRGGVYPGVVGW